MLPWDNVDTMDVSSQQCINIIKNGLWLGTSFVNWQQKKLIDKYFGRVTGHTGLENTLNLFPLIPACTGRPGLPLSAPDIAFLASPSRRL